MAACRGIVYDEDDVPRRCGFTSPEPRDHVEIAVDDACWHQHEAHGRCGLCMDCLKRIGNLWEAL